MSYGEDLAQETLARAWAAQASYKPNTNMKAWTFLILRNLYYGHRRRSWRSAPLEPDAAERMLVAPGGADERLELDELRRALAMLPPNHREAILLVGAAGLSYDEVAELMDCAVGTVKSRVNRARVQLERLCAGGPIDHDGRPPGTAMAAIFHQIDGYRAAA